MPCDERGGKLLLLGMRSLPCHVLSSLHNQHFMEGKRKKNCFFLPHGLGCPCFVLYPPHLKIRLQHPPSQYRAALEGQQAEVGCQSSSVQGPSLCCPCNPRAICKRSKHLVKGEKSLGGLRKFACELLTELQVGQYTLKLL